MAQKRAQTLNLILIWLDALCLLASYAGAYVISGLIRNDFTGRKITEGIWLVLLSYFLVFLTFNMNKNFMRRNKYEEVIYILKLNVFMGLILVCVFYFAKQLDFIGRSIWVFTMVLDVLFMTCAHLVLKRILRRYYKLGKKNYLLVITTSELLEATTAQISKNNTYSGYVIDVAVIDKDMTGRGRVNGCRIVASEDDVETFAKRQVIDEVLIVLGDDRKSIRDYVVKFAEMGVIVHVNADVLEDMEGYYKQLDVVEKFPVVSIAPRFFDTNKLLLKRIIDIAGAIVGLAITAIVTIFLAPIIKIESPGPIFFKQKRVGINGRYFYIYKFRSMYKDAEARKAALMEKNEMKGLMFKMSDDPRITKVGKFIRATSIDELPQFWNILKGDMSLVGTRPPTVEEFKQYEGHHKRRLSMKPGLTGLWQVSGRSNIEDFEEVVRLDCEYIDNWSIQLDLQIILKTIVVVFKKVGSK